MILILLYWLYLFVVFSMMGLGIQKIWRLKKLHVAIIPFFGAFGMTLLASCWAFLGPLDNLFDVFVALVSIALGFILKSELKDFIKALRISIIDLPPFLKLLFATILVAAAYKSAGVPFILDNESYYIQTIKWLDTYGWTHGLANLHPFLGQQSGWHLMHSAMNLDGIFSSFNDINGFLLVLANLYALNHLSGYIKHQNRAYLVIALFPIFNVFLFQFIDAPSPDLGIYLLSYFIFSEYLKSKEGGDSSWFTTLSILCMWAVFIKGTGLFLIIFPLSYLWAKNVRVSKSELLKTILLGLGVCLLFLGKNIWVTGYPIFPLDLFWVDVPWKFSSSLMDFLHSQMQPSGFKMTPEQLADATFLKRLKHWLLLPNLTGLFNILMTALLLIFPAFVKRSAWPKASILLYIAALLQMILLWATSPQYRFFFGFTMLFVLVILALLLKNKMAIYSSFLIIWLACISIIWLPEMISGLSDNPLQKSTKQLSWSQLVVPANTTRYPEANFGTEKLKNLMYYSPQDIPFFWGTGNGPLPCVRQEQLEYFETYYMVIPQLLGDELKDGFYALPL